MHTYIQKKIIFPVYGISFAKGATRLLRGASRLAELSLIKILKFVPIPIIGIEIFAGFGIGSVLVRKMSVSDR